MAKGSQKKILMKIEDFEADLMMGGNLYFQSVTDELNSLRCGSDRVWGDGANQHTMSGPSGATSRTDLSAGVLVFTLSLVIPPLVFQLV